MNNLFFSKTRRFFSLSLLLFTFVAVILQLNIFYTLLKHKVISISFSQGFDYGAKEIIVLLIVFAFFSSLISVVLAVFVNSKIVDPLENISEAMQSVVDGNLDIQLDQKSAIVEVNQIILNFNTLVRALKSNEEASTQMIENITHEMKTPLTAIQGFAQILESEIEDPKQKEMLSCISSSTSHLSKMTQQMTQLIKLVNQEISLPYQKFNLTEQVREVILDFQNQWNDKKLDLVIELEDDVIIKGHEEYLYHVWRNLIENAIKYNNVGGTLLVRLKNQQSDVQVEIGNSGKALSDEEISQIYLRFQQLDSSRLTDGMGLGVPIAKRIVELHQGRFEIINKDNEMISVKINLPKYLNIS